VLLLLTLTVTTDVVWLTTLCKRSLIFVYSKDPSGSFFLLNILVLVSKMSGRNYVTKEEINLRVLKLKTEIFDKQYKGATKDWEDGAHFMLNRVLHMLQEYRG